MCGTCQEAQGEHRRENTVCWLSVPPLPEPESRPREGPSSRAPGHPGTQKNRAGAQFVFSDGMGELRPRPGAEAS